MNNVISSNPVSQEFTVFNFESSPIREITIEGKPWFVAKDVASALGYVDTQGAVTKHCKKAKSLKELDPLNRLGYINQGLADNAKMLLESDIYRLALKSKLDSAERFQDWIVEDVLPSIRKTGSYISTPTTYLEALESLVLIERERVRLEQEVVKLNTVIDNEFGYCSILRAAMFTGVSEKHFNWRILKAITLTLGLEIKRVPSPRYEYQNLYPIKAFEQAYPDLDFDGLTPEKIDDKILLAYAKH